MGTKADPSTSFLTDLNLLLSLSQHKKQGLSLTDDADASQRRLPPPLDPADVEDALTATLKTTELSQVLRTPLGVVSGQAAAAAAWWSARACAGVR